MTTENTRTNSTPQRAIRLRSLASMLALVAGTAAVVIAVLYLNGVLG